MATHDTLIAEHPADAGAGAASVPRETIIPLTWHRMALGVVMLVAAILDFWQLDRIGYGNTYYAAAIRSMLQSWHNFFYNSFDPGGFVTIDKPPVGFWLQVASAKVFGYSGLSLMLPQALAGVLSIAVLYHLVARAFGRVAGLLAALALAVMPVSVATNRNNIIDSTLALVILLAAWAVVRAAETGRLRWLLLCAALVGLGFNVKMLEAFLVVPAFGLLYLVAAPIKWSTRIWQLVVATVVLLAISLSWAVAVDATPASQRPYVGSSGTNSEIDLAFGYNGLERLTGRLFFGGRAGAATQGRTPSTPAAGATSAQRANAGGFTRGETGNPGPLRLFNSALGGQISWLLPLALLGLIVAAWRTRPRFPLDRRQQSLLLWGTWLLVEAAFFSVAGFFHTYYMVVMAPSIAALAGIGIVALWRDFRAAGWRGWALPVALLMTVAVQAYMLSAYPDWAHWLTPLIVGLAIVAALALLLVRLGVRLAVPAALAAAGLGVVALLATPTAWAAYTVANTNGGATPTAGPRPQGGGGGFPGFAAPDGRGESARAGGRGAGGRGSFGARGFGGYDDASANTQLVRYLEENQGKTRYLLATLNSMTASPIIISTGKPVMALGGFSGADRIVTPGQLSTLVSNGTVRFFLLNGGSGRGGAARGGANRSFNLDDLPPQIRAFVKGQGGPGDFGGFGEGGNADLTRWVSSNCATVPSNLWQGTSATSNNPGGFPGFSFGRGGGEQLYDCASHPGNGSRGNTSGSSTNPGRSATPPATAAGATPSINQPVLSGQWVAGSTGTVTVQSFQGQQSLAATSSTRFYLITTASASDLAVGQRVAIASGRAGASTAGSVTIAASGSPYISVRPFGFGGPGSGGAPGGNGGSGRSGGFGNPAGGNGSFGGSGRNGFNRVRRSAVAGTITVLQGNTVTIKTGGASRTVMLTPSTAFYRVVQATQAQFKTGRFVAVGNATVGGQRVATDVAQSTVDGAMPTIVAAATSAGTGTGV